ncbi:MAG: glycerol-3-phosphate 1-O-acyltransferase PlsY [Planctomycetia bacterium]|nr:glycerol-3-phosphate 1-O-acyltransferase PlsY [Planctomycetia bacterium]
MNETALGLALALAAYLVGSIPFGFITGHLIGKIDIRRHGSGNIGATNVGRVLGNRWGLFVLALDFLKGFLPTAFLPVLFMGAASPGRIHWHVATGIATVLGHMFPCWLKFRGGKGVATALGVVAWLAPWPTLAAASVFAVTFAIWRIVSLSSILASLSFAACQLSMAGRQLFSPENWSLSAFSLLVPALILLRHRANIVRIWRGEEPRYRSGGSSSESGSA